MRNVGRNGGACLFRQASVFLSLLFLLTVLCISVSACAPFTVQTQNCANQLCSSPPPNIWAVQPGQTFVMGAKATFALERIEITPQQFRFYYIFEAPSSSSLRVTASASQVSNLAHSTALVTTVQTLGRISAYAVGVVHVAQNNNADQLITLQIAVVLPSGVVATIWRLAPLKQLIANPQPHTMRAVLFIEHSGLPEAQWYGPNMDQQVSYVKVVIPGQAVADRSYVFLRSDSTTLVTVLTKAQYLAIAGAANFIP